MLNERDGGINGVKISFEECETGYATDRGVECYERLKGKGPTGAAYFSPLSTGITFALTEKAPGDKVPLITMGYGRSDSRDGAVFEWNFLAARHLLDGGQRRHPAHRQGVRAASTSSRARRSRWSITTRPTARSRSRRSTSACRRKYGFEFLPIPVAGAGHRAEVAVAADPPARPDYVLLLGLGRHELRRGHRGRQRQLPARQDAGRVGGRAPSPTSFPPATRAPGYKALMLQHPAGKSGGLCRPREVRHRARASGSAKPDEIGSVLYNRGLINSMLGTESIRTAMAKFGNKPMTGEQVRWGIEHLDLTADAHQAAWLRGHDRTDQGVVRRPRGHAAQPRPPVGRQEVERDLRLVHGRRRRRSCRWSRTRRPSTPPRRRSRRATARRRADRPAEPRKPRPEEAARSGCGLAYGRRHKLRLYPSRRSAARPPG